MMKIIAMAGLTLRAAVRSRVFALLIAMVVICIAGLPLMIKSDGTAVGQARLFLHYAFGLAAALLSIAAAWSAAGAVSLEVSGRQMHVLVTKPVYALEVWLGKWLGLMAINLIVLALAGGLIYGCLLWTTRASALSPGDRDRLRGEVLAAHSYIPPEKTDAKPVRFSGALRCAMFAVAPGGQQSWDFRVPPRAGAGDNLFLQFQFAVSRVDRGRPVNGLWTITGDDGAGLLRAQGSYRPHVSHTLKLPPAAPGARLTVAFGNIETAAPATVLFDEDAGARLLIRESSFEGNLMRALLLGLARLSFFTALGLTAGALFSFPVAVFTAFAFLFITGLRGWIGADALLIEADLAPAWLAAGLNAAARGILQLVGYITPPLARFDPLNFLPEGVFIPWMLVGAAWGLLALAYGGALAAMGIWLFSRREMGLAAVD